MFVLLMSLVVCLFILSFVSYSFFSSATRLNLVKAWATEIISSLFNSRVASYFLVVLFTVFCLVNLIGNIPLFPSFTMYYRLTLTCRLLFWVPIMICVFITQLPEFIAHLFPYGSPIALVLLLPLVELFSQIIRPLTLMIRLRTNLSSGHIIIYMFSYFSLLSAVLSPILYLVLSLLFVLEVCISMLQAYIFVSLISLYVSETVLCNSIGVLIILVYKAWILHLHKVFCLNVLYLFVFHK